MTEIGSSSIDVAVEHNSTPLYTLRTVFPFTLFPNVIRIYENRVVIIFKYFLFRYELPILLAYLKSVTASASAFFSTMHFEVTGAEQNPTAVYYLKRDEALYARRLITGLILCNKQRIDLTGSSRSEIVKSALKLGS